MATQGIVNTLAATDEKSAVTAALEAIHERLAWDTDLLRTVRQRYEEIAALAASKPKAEWSAAPAPIAGQGTRRVTGFAKTDPYQLLEEFGPDQLRAALSTAKQQTLRDAVAIIQAREPDSKPRSKTVNQDMIDFIMEHVAGPGY